MDYDDLLYVISKDARFERFVDNLKDYWKGILVSLFIKLGLINFFENNI